MGLTPLIWQPAPQAHLTRDDDWPLVDDLVKGMQLAVGDPERAARLEALQALIDAAFNP
ncbi:hypothetical protein [Paracoccus tibetensis]|uniref:Uncharacterized protein n=1 Tax=Paracoccus tibetensis TaxID=336292 RepID=A0A1G5B7H7_9RHOB|nr:hypothetical protein [Paracoccus tibetensis]SCX86082.1 hypothetical protein SAMN05660710_00028 [Paracoccus tibetensis]